MTTLTPSTVWRISRALLGALDAHLGPPIDSYVNGTQVWLTPEPTNATEADATTPTLEWRLHPPAGFTAPSGTSHHDLWDEAQAALAPAPGAGRPGEQTDAHPAGGDTIVIGGERRSLTSLWEGLECFPAYGDEMEPAALVARACEVLPIGPSASGLVDHGRIGKTWERSGGSTSLVEMLFEELEVGG